MGTANRLKNHYLTWDLNILAYYRFGEEFFLFDEFRYNKATEYNF